MTRIDVINRLATLSRRNLLVTALVCAVSVAIHFTSTAGEDTNNPPPCRAERDRNDAAPSLHLVVLSPVTTSLAAIKERQQ